MYESTPQDREIFGIIEKELRGSHQQNAVYTGPVARRSTKVGWGECMILKSTVGNDLGS